ncbi:MAG: general secretion pathway protein GspL [Burkholderiaceae bacterium]|uniref:General secretion pathway protein GspL n=1 Tax=Cupriavidus metallidurans TaxID=119219 RepID=A0A2L0XB52_9BURK|nr:MULTISPECIES: type II secretion system protein GspL [Cupriavidus]PCH57494.1 MAG: general secretion pathway protein GspL [Burkholderiaceae bacterium]AVA37333.1 general secretion pathway protein GspL [Cupriavidus metallidurans]KWR84574.1 general secretion pathway protein GspL [Cupriavidus sp. SHE]QBP11342.1 general secretion pathway protein GspL [Cupriavidus metallidurans]QWC88416.1 general secretion pathway protein GspL [Cupriavidus metallidurans]
MSTTLYVRLPHRPHDQPQPWQFGAMPFALVRTPVGDKNRRQAAEQAPELLREGHAVPSEMPPADRLVLIVAASDVLLTAAMVPPLPPVRMRLALPNLVEDVLATDAAPCHIALGPAFDGAGSARGPRRRLLMVTDRAWMRAALDQFAEHKHRRRHVVAAQLCLPLAAPVTAPEPAPEPEPALATADGPASPARAAGQSAPTEAGTADTSPEQPATLVVEAATSTLAQSALLLDTAAPAPGELSRLWQLTVRTGPYEGYGLLLDDRALSTWQLLAPAGQWHGDNAALANAPVQALQGKRPPMHASRASETWRIWLAGVEECLQQPQLDLAQFEFAQGRMDRWNVRAWRWPALLVVALLLVQIVGMNAQWLALRKEAKRLEAAQVDLLHTAFPNVPPVAEPILLMRRQVEQLRTASGRSTPNDFLPLADGFARAARDLPPDALLQLEYRAATLYVTLKPGTNTSALQNAVRQVGLQMDEDRSPSDAASRSGGAPTPTGSHWTVKAEGGTAS